MATPKSKKAHSDAYYTGYKEGRSGKGNKGRVSADEYAGFKRGYSDAGWGPGNGPPGLAPRKPDRKAKRKATRTPKRKAKRKASRR